jgi:low temperature requirement protein LtrA
MNDALKRATWIELFYDLAFVALVAQLTYLVAEYHTTAVDYLNIFIVGYSIFIAWWATSVNRNLQTTETATDKFLIQLQMVGAFVMSLTMPAVFVGSYVGFFVTLSLVRFVQVFMLLRMYRLHPETAPVTYNVVQGLLIAGTLWLVSGFTTAEYHFIVALMALAIDILTPLSVGRGNAPRLLNVAHLKERLGLFLMLVMGESMIVVALANTATALTAVEPLTVVSGLLFMIALWWLYFEYMDTHLEVRPRNLFLFLHAHAGLYAGIILLSVGYKFLLKGTEPDTTLTFLVFGMSLIALTILLVRSTLHVLCVRAGVLLGLHIAIGIAMVWYGFTTDRAFAASAIMTLLFCSVALLERFGAFAPSTSSIIAR